MLVFLFFSTVVATLGWLVYFCVDSLQRKLIFVGFAKGVKFESTYNLKEINLPLKAIELQGWQFRKKQTQSNIVILYFGGNAGNVARNMKQFISLDVKAVYSFNYRGYGNSGGAPSQKHLYQDALSIYDFVKKQNTQSEILVIGRSLGSAVASYVSAHRKVCGSILLTPLKSISAIAREQYPRLPVSLLLYHPFVIERYVKNFQAPTLVALATDDLRIPVEHSLHTFHSINAEKELLRLDGANHDNIFTFPQLMQGIESFVGKLNYREHCRSNVVPDTINNEAEQESEICFSV